MMTSTTEEQAAQAVTAATAGPKGAKRPTVAPPARRVAPAKGKAAKKATPAKKGAHGAKAGKRAKAAGARQGSKTATVLDLVKRPGGATLKALLQATGWQPHYADVRIMPTCVGN